MKKLKNGLILLLLSVLLSNNVNAQYWYPKSTDTLILKNNSNTFSPLYLGVGVEFPTALLHTKGTVRHEDLVDTKDSFVVVTDLNGNINRAHIDSLLKGRIPSSSSAWLLTGNTATSSDYIGTNNPEDFRVYTAGLPRGRYTLDGNYELGTTNTFTGSQITHLGGSGNTANTVTNVLVYGGFNDINNSINAAVIGSSNFSDRSASFGIMGAENNIINSSDAVVALGKHCTIDSSDEGGVFGEDLNMRNSHGSFMAGGHSWINQTMPPSPPGPSKYGYNMSLGAVNIINASNSSHTYGNNNMINNGESNFAFGNGLEITNANEAFALGSGFSNDLNTSIKMGFNNNRTMTLTESGVEIQMAPGNPLYTPSLNLEVMAGSSGGTVSEIQFQDLPTTSSPYDMVLINPSTFKLYRAPNCCNSGGVSSSCSTQFMVPRVNASGSADLVCSQIFDNGTSVGIGTTTPRTFTGAGMLIAGAPAIPTLSQLDVAGLTFTNTLVVLSDARLKKDVKPIKSALETVVAMNGVTYSWEKEKYKERNLDNLPQAGFLAQDVEKVYPRAVVKDKEGFYAMNYNAVIPLLNEAIKELNVKVEAQKDISEENKILQSKIKILEKKLSGYDQKFSQLEDKLSQICEMGCNGLRKQAEANTFSLSTEKDVVIYPNPSKGLIHVKFKGELNTDAEIIVTTMAGKEVLKSKLQQDTLLDMSEYARGSYLIVLRNNGQTLTRKITLE